MNKLIKITTMIKLEFKVLFPFFILLISFSLSFALPVEKGKVVNIRQTSYDYIAKQIIEVERDRVIERANKFLDIKPRTVTASSSRRSSGGKHDFFSEGPYWWPDPANPDGVFIRNDGLRNPDRFENHDDDLRFLSWIVGTQTSAYLLSGEEKYAKSAMEHLNAWFVDTTTLMNPNMLYAQAIHGICTGRGIGIIDAVPLMDVSRSVMILEKSPYVSGKDIVQIKVWFSQFIIWLTTHPYGIDEKNAKNNHGTWWHAQVAAYASLVGDKRILEDCRSSYMETILPDQMAADGSFPLELKRTKPYSYSLFNLDATASLAWILSDKSFDVWNYSLPDGRGIKKGLDFILPYLKDKTTWTFGKDVSHWEVQPGARQFMLYAAVVQNNQEWFELWKSLDEKDKSDESRLALPLKNPLLWIGLIDKFEK